MRCESASARSATRPSSRHSAEHVSVEHPWRSMRAGLVVSTIVMRAWPHVGTAREEGDAPPSYRCRRHIYGAVEGSPHREPPPVESALPSNPRGRVLRKKAPKEQPPRNLSGSRTARARQLWKAGHLEEPRQRGEVPSPKGKAGLRRISQVPRQRGNVTPTRPRPERGTDGTAEPDRHVPRASPGSLSRRASQDALRARVRDARRADGGRGAGDDQIARAPRPSRCAR